MKHYKSLLHFSKQKQNNSPKQLAFIIIGTLFAFSGYYVYYNVRYMDQIAAGRIQEFEEKSGMKISEFKTENPIKEEIRPEYIERQKRIYRQKMEETRKQLQQQQK
ncbi:unnamed protein product [Paramecium octaurelia]|uniref:Uncharacterized protein n=1 Tax=Paramecium octaurelia TaxID=43137 RepID=A0A8S1Y373_PAROT|nr:unnamed protein product [Paramecium octaurelia]